jgi:hypothetical protein
MYLLPLNCPNQENAMLSINLYRLDLVSTKTLRSKRSFQVCGG